MPESVSFLLAKDRKGEAEELTRRFDLPIQFRDRRLCAKGGRSSYAEEHTRRSATGILQEVRGSDFNLYGCLFPEAVVGVRVEHVVAWDRA